MKTMVKEKKPSMKTAHGLASIWIEFKKEEENITKRRKELGERIIAQMKALGIAEIEVEDQTVHLIRDKNKKVNKQLISDYFGKERTDPFWKTLPDKVSEYLSLSLDNGGKR